MDLIKVSQLKSAPRLQDISFTLAPGQMLGIIGPNGSGKSSLLQCLAGLLDYQGDIQFQSQTIHGLPARQRAQRIGFLPQSCYSAWPLSVADIVTLGRLPWGDADSAAIEQAIQQTGIEALRHQPIDALSGGEQSRVWLARVVAGQPVLLLADEPIASLDLLYQRSVMQTLRQFADQGKGVILAIHDFSLAARYCDRLCLLQKGQLFAFGRPEDVLTEENLSAVFQVPVHVDLSSQPPIITPK